MTAIATRTLKPIKKRVAQIEKRASRAAANTDRALSRVEDNASELAESGWSLAKSFHARIEDRPHASVVAALALGSLFGFFLRPRR